MTGMSSISQAIAFDESGNTGPNLLDPEQPVFALASLKLDSAQATALGASPTGELKFSRLVKSAIGRDTILRIADSNILTPDSLAVSAFHKKYLVAAKLIDLVIEPFLHAGKMNLYDRGANIAMANMIFYTWPAILGREIYSTIERRFVDMVRDKSAATISAFYTLIEAVRRSAGGNKLKVELDFILWGRQLVEVEEMPNWSGNVLDPAIPAFVEHAAIWTRRLEEPFRIVHDRSKPIEQEQIVLEAMLTADGEPEVIGFDRRKMMFPIRAHGIEFGDSKVYLPLQIADIISSGAAYLLKARIEQRQSDFLERLLATHAFSGEFHPVWPHLAFSPEELGTTEPAVGPDPHVRIGEYVARRLGGIPPPRRRSKRS
jgi:hypothetical protein